MGHPFRVGGKYQNRDGEYEVIELGESKMTIRYSDGQIREVTVKTQAQIWQNIQIEERAATRRQAVPPPHTSSTPHSSSSQDRRGCKFHGLQDNDFQRGTAGTSWRARDALGGLLAKMISGTTGSEFESFSIYRRADVHIARIDRFVEERRLREAKFVFLLDAAGASYGFYVEKNSGPMDNTWNWLKFLTALENDSALQQKLQPAMEQMQLHWDVFVQGEGGFVARVEPVRDGLTWKLEHEEKAEEITWSEFTGRLKGIDPDHWCDLYLLANTGKKQAIDAGVDIAKPAVEVYRVLLPLYNASTC